MSQTSDIANAPLPARPEVERDWSRSLWTVTTWVVLAVLLVWSWAPAEMSRWTYLFSDASNDSQVARAKPSPPRCSGVRLRSGSYISRIVACV